MKFEEKYVNELEELKSDEEKILLFYDALTVSEDNSAENCLNLSKFLLDYCDENRLFRAKSLVLYYYGWICIDLGDFEKTIEIFISMNELVEKIDYTKGRLYSYNALLSAYCTVGEYSLSKEYGKRGIKLAKNSDREMYIKMLVNLAITNIERKDFEDAIEILLYVDKITLESDENIYVALNKAKAEAYYYLNRLNDASEAVDKALNYSFKSNNDSFKPEMYKLKGMINAKKGNYAEAEKNFKTGLKFGEKIGFHFENLKVIQEWSKLRLLQNKDEKFLNMQNYLKQEGYIGKYRDIVYNSALSLYEYYGTLNNNEKALEYLEELLRIDESKEICDFEHMQNNEINCKNDFDIDIKPILYDVGGILTKFGNSILSELRIENLRATLNEEVREIVNCSDVGLAYLDDETRNLVLFSYDQNNDMSAIIKSIDDERCLMSKVFNKKRALLLNNKSEEYGNYVRGIKSQEKDFLRFESVMLIPIIFEKKAYGMIVVQAHEKNAFTYKDLNILKSIASYSGIALVNAMKYEKLEQIAMYDSLTGFLTRREILKLGEELKWFETDENHELNNKIYIGMIDIDNFKIVNDSYGHIAGDVLLKLVSKTIMKNVRTEDNVGRYGGDEFLIISTDISKSDMYAMLERVRKQVENALYEVNDEVKIHVTLSIGLHEIREEEKEFIESVDFADKILYKVKKECKNKVHML